MAIRRLLSGQLSAAAVEPVVEAVAERYDLPADRVSFLEADNWLSTPLVIDEEVFVKVITDRHTLVHALLTAGRNLGAFSSGTEGFFGHFESPVEMAEHELVATQRMRELGVNVPEPLEAFEIDEFGVLVLEYLPEFRTLDVLDPETVRSHAPDLFEALSTMHEGGLVHGDLRAENVLVADGDLYFIDATNVRGEGPEDAQAYDVACALGALEPEIGARATVAAALTAYSPADLLDARAFLDFVNIRPDHSFDAAAVKGEVEREAT